MAPLRLALLFIYLCLFRVPPDDILPTDLLLVGFGVRAGMLVLDGPFLLVYLEG